MNQLELGCYMHASWSSLIISPLGAISKDEGEIQIIHDASQPLGKAMNDYCTLSSVRYQLLQEACDKAKPGSFMAKIVLNATYWSPIRFLFEWS